MNWSVNYHGGRKGRHYYTSVPRAMQLGIVVAALASAMEGVQKRLFSNNAQALGI